MNCYSFVYGFGVGVIVVLTYFLNKESPDTESKRYLVLLSVATLIWICSEFLYYTPWGTITVSIYYAKLVSIVFLPYFSLMTVLRIPIRNKVLKFRYTPLIFFMPVLISLFFIFIAPFNKLFISNLNEIRMIDGYPRYDAIPGTLVFVWFLPHSCESP